MHVSDTPWRPELTSLVPSDLAVVALAVEDELVVQGLSSRRRMRNAREGSVNHCA
jgi:hypothetical protein